MTHRYVLTLFPVRVSPSLECELLKAGIISAVRGVCQAWCPTARYTYKVPCPGEGHVPPVLHSPTPLLPLTGDFSSGEQ